MENSRLWFNTVSADLRSANTHDEKLGQDEDDLLQVKVYPRGLWFNTLSAD